MKKLNISVVIGIIVALVGAGLVLVYGRHVNNKIAGGKQTMSVLVADQALAAGASAGSLTGHVHVAQIPAAYVVKGALSTPTALTNAAAQNAVLVGGVPQGGQLSFMDFAQGAAAGLVSPSKGDVALSVETPLSSGVARYLEPGQLVDVFATYAQSGGAQSPTKLFASGVKVLSVSVAAPKSGSNDSTDNNSDTSTPSGSVIVLLNLSPEDAQKVVNATTLGSIYLAYTNNANDKTAQGATPQSVLSSNR
jgi:Flp pilus assembly protein CpaB